MDSKSKPEYHLCSRTFLVFPGRIGNLSLGSFFKRALMRSPTGPWHLGGNGTLPMPFMTLE